jgi:hypothetical protein
MKKHIALMITVLSFFSTQSQTVADALLFSKDNLTGTARFSALSGAFGALGGDFSAINVNPAGSAVFSNNQASVTFSNYNVKKQSEYFGTKISTSNMAFDISQAGGALIFMNTDEKSPWKKFVLSLDYENNSNFDNSLTTFGTNPNQSVADYFVSYANPDLYNSNIPLSELQNSFYEDLDIRTQQAFLANQVNVIKVNPNNPNNDTYISNVPAGDFYQYNESDTRGYSGKVAFNFASQYKDKFYFGFNLNSHFIDIKKKTFFYEENDNRLDPNTIKDLLFGNYQHTYGNGFSFQLGAIAKITTSLRAGLSYESPTWYRLVDERMQFLSSSRNSFTDPENFEFTTDSDILLIYPTYKLQTPSKFTGSLAYVFGKSGLISLDYSIKDYGNATFSPNDTFFRPLNNGIENQLHAASELRIGGEYRIKAWSLRGGYRYEQSPYKDKKTMGDLAGFSTGFGYNFGNTRLDLSYAHSQRKSQEAFFTQGFSAAPKIKTENDNFALTLVFEL